MQKDMKQLLLRVQLMLKAPLQQPLLLPHIVKEKELLLLEKHLTLKAEEPKLRE